MERMTKEVFTGEVVLDLTVAYQGTHLKEDLEFAGFEALVFNHNGEVVKLDIMDWKVKDGRFFNDGGEYLEGLGVAISDIRLYGLVDIEEENEVTAKMALDVNCGNKYDIVVANILADVIIPLSGVVKPFLKEDGYFITSGIIATKKEDVRQSLQAAGFEIEEVMMMEDWVTIISRKPSL